MDIEAFELYLIYCNIFCCLLEYWKFGHSYQPIVEFSKPSPYIVIIKRGHFPEITYLQFVNVIENLSLFLHNMCMCMKAINFRKPRPLLKCLFIFHSQNKILYTNKGVGHGTFWIPQTVKENWNWFPSEDHRFPKKKSFCFALLLLKLLIYTEYLRSTSVQLVLI